MTLSAGREVLKILDMEIMRGHSTKTLKQWRQALRQNNATIGQDYDERFIRMWKFTLLAANISFAVRMGWYFNCNWPMIMISQR